MRVGIIGAGLMCKRRAPVLKGRADTELVAIASKTKAHAEAMAQQFECAALDTWQELVERDDIDAVIVSTPPHVHAEISIAAMQSGKHVLCEKPLTRTLEGAQAMIDAAEKTGKTLKCGFNHRHHPAIWDAKQRVATGEIGKPLFARCRYGICGRPGYEKKWRADPEQAAGGQFMEQGTHGIDLIQWFLGQIVEVSCMTGIQYFHDQELDDNGMATFRTASGGLANLHASLTQWKNMFSFEVFGEDGYLTIDGLGASYGTETLSIGRRDFDAPFQDHVVHYRGGDISWAEEWKEFEEAIEQGREPIGSGHDGLSAMRVGLAAYESEKSRTIVTIESA